MPGPESPGQLPFGPPQDEPEEPRQRNPATAPATAYQPRSDGGFGPKGSGGSNGAAARQSYGSRGPMQWLASSEDSEEQGSAAAELRTGDGYRPGESGGGAAPQYLIEADDLYDEEYGESMLVAPPVLGAVPQSHRDF